MNLNPVMGLVSLSSPVKVKSKTRTDDVSAEVTLPISRSSSEITAAFDRGMTGRPPGYPLATNLPLRNER